MRRSAARCAGTPSAAAEVRGERADVGTLAAADGEPRSPSAARRRGRTRGARARPPAPRAARARPDSPARAASWSRRPPTRTAEYIGGTCSISPTKPRERRADRVLARARTRRRARRPGPPRPRCPSPRRTRPPPRTPCRRPRGTAGASPRRRRRPRGRRSPRDRACRCGRPSRARRARRTRCTTSKLVGPAGLSTTRTPRRVDAPRGVAAGERLLAATFLRGAARSCRPRDATRRRRSAGAACAQLEVRARPRAGGTPPRPGAPRACRSRSFSSPWIDTYTMTSFRSGDIFAPVTVMNPVMRGSCRPRAMTSRRARAGTRARRAPGGSWCSSFSSSSRSSPSPKPSSSSASASRASCLRPRRGASPYDDDLDRASVTWICPPCIDATKSATLSSVSFTNAWSLPTAVTPMTLRCQRSFSPTSAIDTLNLRLHAVDRRPQQVPLRLQRPGVGRCSVRRRTPTNIVDPPSARAAAGGPAAANRPGATG